MDDTFVVFLHGDLFNMTEHLIQQITEIHKVNSRNTDRVTQAESVKFVNINFLFYTVDFIDNKNDRFSRRSQHSRNFLVLRLDTGLTVNNI